MSEFTEEDNVRVSKLVIELNLLAAKLDPPLEVAFLPVSRNPPKVVF